MGERLRNGKILLGVLAGYAALVTTVATTITLTENRVQTDQPEAVHQLQKRGYVSLQDVRVHTSFWEQYNPIELIDPDADQGSVTFQSHGKAPNVSKLGGQCRIGYHINVDENSTQNWYPDTFVLNSGPASCVVEQ